MALSIDTRSLRLTGSETFPAGERKTGIAIHHTVGGSAESSVRWWKDSRQMVGTAYLIERDGTIFEVFDPTAWAWQFGLPWSTAKRIAFEKRFIGIEIASEGGLLEADGNLYCFDRVSPRTLKRRDEAFDFGSDYRGYRYFDRYEPAQVDSLVRLVDELCGRFDIPRRVPSAVMDFHGDGLADFEGVIGHAMVRSDKSDPIPDASLWQRLMRDGNLVEAVSSGGAITTSAESGPASPANDLEDTETLFEHNVQQIDRMNVAAGSMVKGLIMELERAGRNTYIRLRDPVPKGHAVGYDFLRGDRSLVGRVGRALGFASVTDDRLEVRSG